MGAYLSEPVTTKESTDEVNDKLECGASSMQGWRVNQEDAHNTILNYDEETSYFAVYDGHGGAEVATYCSKNLPDFIKSTEAYKSGDIEKALEDAFLGFDETIASKEVMAILKEMAGEVNPPPTSDEAVDSEEDENVSNLFHEAKLPLQEVLAKYESKLPFKRNKLLLNDDVTPLSPFLRAKQNARDEECGPSRSSDGPPAEVDPLNATSSSNSEPKASASSSSSSGYKTDDSAGPSSSNACLKMEEEGVSSSTTNEIDKDANGEVSTSDVNKTEEKVKKDSPLVPDSSEDNCDEPQSSAPPKVKGKDDSKTVCNGEVTESIKNVEESDISSSQNGETKKVKSGKAKDKTAGVSSSEVEEKPEQTSPTKRSNRQMRAAAYNSLLTATSDSEDESDSNDETFQHGEEISSDEENVNGVSESEEDEVEGEEDDEEEEEDSSDEDYEEDISMMEEPGADSGCTAVVAILKGNELYVANAGDSRCIVCRSGRAIDMSVDHKPEDEPELQRILKAGGKVTSDGRINGGLNLSRAIGDHSYKQNKFLNAREQMITALPDVKKLTIDPETDEFMVLACDGIWNFMSSQDVADFILPKMSQPREKLSQICEEMFDHCLAPSTMGDGTGCDNMTAIIVKFKKSSDGTKTEMEAVSVSTSLAGSKRVAEEDPDNDSKRPRVEDTLSSSVVTSSVHKRSSSVAT